MMNKLEDKITRHIFEKYIKSNNNNNNNNLTLSEFRKSIYKNERNKTQTQEEILIETLTDMHLAQILDIELDESDKSNKSKISKKKAEETSMLQTAIGYGFSDAKRCNYIVMGTKQIIRRCKDKQCDEDIYCNYHYVKIESDENVKKEQITLKKLYNDEINKYPKVVELIKLQKIQLLAILSELDSKN